MSETSEIMKKILGPKTFDTAMMAIDAWDRNARTAPLISQQIAMMRDGPMSWSITHSWEAVMSVMISAGLIYALPKYNHNGFSVNMTEITELGREVRAHFRGR